MIGPEPGASEEGKRLRAALSSWWEPMRARWAQVPPSVRPLLLAGFAIGGVGLILFGVSLLLLARAAQPATPSRPIAVTGAPSGPIPLQLRIGETTFRVAPLAVRGGSWPVPRGPGDTAYWMEGTFANLVFGLPDRPETRRLVEGIREGDPVEVEMSAGPMLRFQVAGKQQIPPDDTSLLAQHRPGLTLLLVGGEPRWAVTASPWPEAAPSFPVGRVPIGLPVQVGPIRLTVRGVEPRWSGPGIPADFLGVVIHVELAHTGKEPLAFERFEMSLSDAAGRRYQPTPLEGVPIPSGSLLPGRAVEVPVAYLIPRNSAEGILVWRFQPLPGQAAPVEVEFEIPPPTPTPEPRSLLQIQVQSAQWMPAEQVLVIRGGIGNPGDQPVTLEAAEVALIGPDGQPVPWMDASPAFPWQIPAGRNVGFELRFALPAADRLTLRIATQRFEIHP